MSGKIYHVQTGEQANQTKESVMGLMAIALQEEVSPRLKSAIRRVIDNTQTGIFISEEVINGYDGKFRNAITEAR